MRSTSMWGSFRISSRQLAKSCSMCTVVCERGQRWGVGGERREQGRWGEERPTDRRTKRQPDRASEERTDEKACDK